MTINRNNYQEYFLLYTDNELEIADKRDVENFIRQNPDLEVELQMLQQSILKPDQEIVFDNKQSLLHFGTEENFIHPGNVEELSILYADNELNDEEKVLVEKYIDLHPRFRQTFNLLQSLKLTADKSLVFTDKETLYRYEKNEKPLLFPWWRMAAAALLLIVAGLLWLYNHPISLESKNMAQTGKGHSINKPENLVKNEIAEKNNTKADHSPNITKTPETGQPGSLAHGSKTNKGIDEKKKLQDKSSESNYSSGKDDISKARTDKEKNVITPRVENQEDHLAATIGNMLKVESGSTLKDIATIDASKKTNNKMNTEQPVITINALNHDVYTASSILVNDNTDENVFLTNSPVEKKNALRGLFRKASRLLDKTTSFGSSKKSGLLIGNVEIAFQ